MTDYTSYYETGQPLPDAFWAEFTQALNNPNLPSYSSTGQPLNTAAQGQINQQVALGNISVGPSGSPVGVSDITTQTGYVAPTQQYPYGFYTPPTTNQNTTPTDMDTFIDDASPFTEDDPDDPDNELVDSLMQTIQQLQNQLNNSSSDSPNGNGDAQNGLFGNLFGEGFNLFGENGLDFSNLFGEGFDFENLFGDMNFDLGFDGLIPGLGEGLATGLFGPEFGGTIGDLFSLPSNIMNWGQEFTSDVRDNFDNAPWNWNNPFG